VRTLLFAFLALVGLASVAAAAGINGADLLAGDALPVDRRNAARLAHLG
jgi:hypothetical protein